MLYFGLRAAAPPRVVILAAISLVISAMRERYMAVASARR